MESTTSAVKFDLKFQVTIIGDSPVGVRFSRRGAIPGSIRTRKGEENPDSRVPRVRDLKQTGFISIHGAAR